MTAVIGYAIAILGSSSPGIVARRAASGLYIGAIMTWLMGMGEIVTGVKLLPMLYPGANTLDAVASSRWIVTATYPNYNDYDVVMAMLFTGVLARLWFQPRRGWVLIGRLFILLSCAAMIVVAGSRGALVACVGAIGLLVILNVRRMHSAAMGVRACVWGGGLLLALAVGVWMSPYVQDHSTAQRGVILSNATAMLVSDPPSLLLGYGSLVGYQSAAAMVYGDMLMDPHNLLLEIVIRYGIVALLLFLVCWVWILVRGYAPRRPAADWQTAYVLSVVLLLPVLGIVPASTLRYHVAWIYMIVASCLTTEAVGARAR